MNLFLMSSARKSKSSKNFPTLYETLYQSARKWVVKIIGGVKRRIADNAINQCFDKPKDMWTSLKKYTGASVPYNVLSSRKISNTFNNFFCVISNEFLTN